MTFARPTKTAALLAPALICLLLCAVPLGAQEHNRLRRIEVRQHRGFTRVTLLFQSPPDYAMSTLPDRVRLDLRGTDAPAFKRLRALADPHIGGVLVTPRQGSLQLSIPFKGAPGVELLNYASPTALTIDIGPALKRPLRPDIAPGREAILAGTEQFVRQYGAPARAGLPFVPTDVKLLQGALAEREVELFQRGEGALYREEGSDAVEIFSWFRVNKPALRALACYRLAQAYYLLERYDEALKCFREAEALWPGYLEQAPQLMQAYAETRARAGDFSGGRALLVRLVDRLSGTGYVAPLLNRLAELSARHGDEALALAIYRSVARAAAGSPAAARARLKLADRDLFLLSRDRYPELLARYQEVYQTPGDFDLRDEALFKMALLLSLYGPAQEALPTVASYEQRYPRGIFLTIVKKMHEELMVPLWREAEAAKDEARLLRLAEENRDFLARCFADPGFAPRLAQACQNTGSQARELALFSYLSEKSFSAQAAPFLTLRVIEDALALGNAALAETSARSFLSRFPADREAQAVRERLGRLAFEKGQHAAAVAELAFLNGAGAKPRFPESDYYLGKACSAAGDQRGAAAALARFTQGAPAGSPLLPDAWYTLAGVRSGLKEFPAALFAYRQGLKLATGEGADQFQYKIGETCLKLNQVREARAAWQEVAQRGPGSTWGRLASDALEELSWRLKIAAQLP